MTAPEIFLSLSKYADSLDGRESSVRESDWLFATEETKSVMRTISRYAVDDSDLKFISGLALMASGRKTFWKTISAMVKKKNPKAIRKDLYLRTERDCKTIERFLKESGKTERDLYSAPEGGDSIAYRLVRSLAISPWCYLRHLDLAQGVKQNRNEVKTNNILKEITHA